MIATIKQIVINVALLLVGSAIVSAAFIASLLVGKGF